MTDIETMLDKMDEWPAPRLFTTDFNKDTEDIPCALLPTWLGGYCEWLSENLQTPTGLAVMLALSAVAATIQKKFEVVLDNGHKESLNLWTVKALVPGSRKTAVINDLTFP